MTLMAESVYDRVNDYGSVKIQLASPNDIRSWSFGEVKKPETINYRTYRAEKDGLFCERIFGPERDWECSCGKYKGTKYKGIICDRCQVKVTHSRVRRKRMGHINLAAPIVHIWFFKALPSRLGAMLDMKTSDLEKLIYFQDYVITEPGQTPLQRRQLLTEEEYRAAYEKYGDKFEAMMGAEAVKKLLAQLDLAAENIRIRADIEKTSSKQKIKDLTKRLKMIEAIRNSENKSEWLVMDVIPVIPPDLRPLVLLESGNFATSDLNDLYRRIINRNNRLKKLVDLNAPEVIIRNEKRMLQQAVDALFDNGRCRRPVLGSSNRPLKSLTDMIKGKQGRFRENLLGKRVDYSARSVIVVGPELKLHQCGLPKKIALELFQPFIIRKLREHGLADTIKSAKKMLERRDPEVWDILEEVIYQHPVLLNRAPTLHRMGIQAFEPVLVEGNAIKIHPLVCRGFNADFDGDQMAVHLPLSVEAQAEAHVLMLSTNNIFSPANGSPIISPSQDIVLGTFYITSEREGDAGEYKLFNDIAEALLAFDRGTIRMHSRIFVHLPRTHVVPDEKSNPVPISDIAWRDGEVQRKLRSKNPDTYQLRAKPASYRSQVILTTIGRCMFNDVLPPEMPFYNYALTAKGISRVVADTYAKLGRPATIKLLDDMKSLGFKRSTLAGISFGITDIRSPDTMSTILDESQKQADKIEKNYRLGAITDQERKSQLIDIWGHARKRVTEDLMKGIQDDYRDAAGKPIPPKQGGALKYMNPIAMMAVSGARGNIDQIRQLGGMRGLMAKPSGEIIETPIKSNFRQGLSVLEYFSSTHGARKGLADTALKTADSGYLTRKLADVAQNVIVSQQDCGTVNGISKSTIYKGETVEVELRDMIVGRTARDTIRNPITDMDIVAENQVITPEIAEQLKELRIETVRVRSPLTCESPRGVCARCYGVDMSTNRQVEEGLAVGIIAAQSIGEPGTQLTMRTFHTGGVATGALTENDIKAVAAGTVEHRDINAVRVKHADGTSTMVALKRNGEVAVMDAKGREVEKYKVPYGATVLVPHGEKVKARQALVQWDAHITPILAEKGGIVRYEDIEEGETVRIEEERKGAEAGISKLVVIEHKGERHPRLTIVGEDGKILDFHYLPAKARIEVKDGQQVQAGEMIARLPKEAGGTLDITGGLPRVTEIFEARKPKDPAVLAEISGTVEIRSDKRRGKMTIIIKNETGMEREHHVPQDKELMVHAGDYVEAGDQLIRGPVIPHDILRIKGEEALHNYLLTEVQNVYRSQGVKINDKHIETILNQMLRKVKVEDAGDSKFLPGEVTDRTRFREANDNLQVSVKVADAGGTQYKEGDIVTREEFKLANEAAEAAGKQPAKSKKPKPARARPLLLGITKASLQSESFISAASFQETTKVLTEAAMAGAIDTLVGLKENVILGHLIPAGTGFAKHQQMVLTHTGTPVDEIEEEPIIRSAREAFFRMGEMPTAPAEEEAPAAAEKPAE
jgi:DNA-directed RNA polymerase subunit beta'